MRSSCGKVSVVVIALMVLQTSSAQETTAKPCRMIKCAPYCVPDKGPDGCPRCACDGPTCQNVTCDRGTVCQLKQVQCFTTPCYPVPTCVSEQETTDTPCSVIKCDPDCVPATGSDGCPTCDCPPSCQTVKCSAGHECQLRNVTCIRYPCFPQPQCVPTTSLCTEAPNTRDCGRPAVRWSYNSKKDTCKRITYYGCTPSPNTFISQKECEDSCKTEEPICNACGTNCFTLKRRNNNKCPKCICPNPCKRIRCRAGYECKLQEETFLPKPYCAKKSV